MPPKHSLHGLPAHLRSMAEDAMPDTRHPPPAYTTSRINPTLEGEDYGLTIVPSLLIS